MQAVVPFGGLPRDSITIMKRPSQGGEGGSYPFTLTRSHTEEIGSILDLSFPPDPRIKNEKCALWAIFGCWQLLAIYAFKID